MCYISLFKSHTSWTNKSFVFRRFTSKVFTNKCDFIDSSFPTFLLSLSRSNNIKHFSLSHWFNLLNGYWPSSSLFFSFLFYCIWEDLRGCGLFSIHQEGRQSSSFDLISINLYIFFFMLLNKFFHSSLLLESLFIEHLSLQSSKCLSFLWKNMSLSCFSLSFFLIFI